jgi:hypothetical protein
MSCGRPLHLLEPWQPKLQVAGTRASTTISNTSAGANLEHWSLFSEGGTFFLARSSDTHASSAVSVFAIASAGGIIIGTTTAHSHGGGTITAAGMYVGSTQLNVPDYVFDDHKHLSIADVVTFVKEHTHLPWTAGRAELGKIDLSQRINAILASVENL